MLDQPRHGEKQPAPDRRPFELALASLLQRTADARQACNRLLVGSDVSIDEITKLAQAAIDAGEHELAAIFCRRAVVGRPALGDELRRLAYAFANSGKIRESVGILSGIVRARPDDHAAEQLLSFVLGDPSVAYFRFMLDRRIDLVFDIGANVGEFARGLRTMGYEGAIVSVEPVAAVFDRLSSECVHDPLWFAERVALGAEPSKSTIHIAANNAASSSLLRMLPRHLRAAPGVSIVGTEEVHVDTFANLHDRHRNLGRQRMLKIDTQGYEKHVLEGGGDLAAIEIIHLELSTVPLYEGQALLPEVLSHLYERGFVLVDIERYMFDPPTRHVLQVNATFLRNA